MLWTPAGAGHVLFLKSADLDGDQVRVYSDNIAMTRYVQEEIESMLFPEFGDTNLPVIPAEFSRSGGIESAYNETVAASTENGGFELARLPDALYAQQPGRGSVRPHARRVQLLLPGPAGADYGGRPGVAGRGVAGNARVGAEQHGVLRVVGDVGEAVGGYSPLRKVLQFKALISRSSSCSRFSHKIAKSLIGAWVLGVQTPLRALRSSSTTTGCRWLCC